MIAELQNLQKIFFHVVLYFEINGKCIVTCVTQKCDSCDS